MEYLGHVVDEEGVRPHPDKVKAISDARSPTNVTEPRAFWGRNPVLRSIPAQPFDRAEPSACSAQGADTFVLDGGMSDCISADRT